MNKPIFTYNKYNKFLIKKKVFIVMSNDEKQDSHTHFEGKEAIHHMAEK